MARVAVLIPDLLFGSRVQADLTAKGHEVRLVSSREAAVERLGEADVLVVDLTDETLAGAALVEALAPNTPLPTLGFYSHVDVAARERARRAGFDLVVPRSRMARESAALVERLASGRL
jgi:CheY-like chemotaxis protein